MKWTRQEYVDLMTFGDIDRPMLVELFGPLIGLEEEWKAQGATEDEINLSAFDFDYVPTIGCGGFTGVRGGFAPQIIEDNAQYTISRDALGRTMKLVKGYATLPLPLDFPVTDMDSWLKIKHMYQFDESRINWDQVERAKKYQRDEGGLVIAAIEGGFDTPRELMGEVNACIAYYEDPELMHDIMDTLTDTAMKVYERISDKIVIDQLSVHEDMAGKSGPLIGPNLVTEFIKPYYRKVWDMLSSRGTKIFCQDSDGNMNPVLDAFIDCGLNVTYPCEPAGGMDIVEIRKKYGERLGVKGGIDKHVLRGTKQEIRNELEYKLQPFMHKGTVFGLDHRIPNGTPLENYKYYVNTAREILGREPITKKTPHKRMAF